MLLCLEKLFHLFADNSQEHVEQTIATFFFFDCCIVCVVFNRNYECGRPFQPLTKKISETIKADFFFFPLLVGLGKELAKTSVNTIICEIN